MVSLDFQKSKRLDEGPSHLLAPIIESKSKKTLTISSIPSALIIHTFSFVKFFQLQRTARTCREWNKCKKMVVPKSIEIDEEGGQKIDNETFSSLPLSKINKIFICRCNITDRGFEFLANCSNLTNLTLNCSISITTLAKIVKNFPNLHTFDVAESDFYQLIPVLNALSGHCLKLQIIESEPVPVDANDSALIQGSFPEVRHLMFRWTLTSAESLPLLRSKFPRVLFNLNLKEKNLALLKDEEKFVQSLILSGSDSKTCAAWKFSFPNLTFLELEHYSGMLISKF